MRRDSLLLGTIAALQGAAGVALAAAAAHTAAGPNLASASQFLMIHAAAGLGLAALSEAITRPARLFSFAAFLMQAGVTLFAGDLTARVYAGPLFPMAAPIGGSSTIGAWLLLGLFLGWRAARPR